MAEKQRFLKIDYIEHNMLIAALLQVLETAGPELTARAQSLGEKVYACKDGRLFLKEDEFDLALYVMNELRNTYLAADRGCGAMDKLMLRLMKSKYKRVPAR